MIEVIVIDDLDIKSFEHLQRQHERILKRTSKKNYRQMSLSYVVSKLIVKDVVELTTNLFYCCPNHNIVLYLKVSYHMSFSLL